MSATPRVDVPETLSEYAGLSELISTQEMTQLLLPLNKCSSQCHLKYKFFFALQSICILQLHVLYIFVSNRF